MAFDYWLCYSIGFWAMTFLISILIFRSYSFIFELSNKNLKWKNLVEIGLSAYFFVITLFIEQLKSRNRSDSLFKFMVSLVYIGIWFWNKLLGGLMQTEAFKIDISEIINTFEKTLNSDLQLCLVVNEPLTYEFLDGKKKIFTMMFRTKSRHLYQAKFDDVLNFMKNSKTRVFLATSIFVKSVSWSVCSYFKVIVLLLNL